MADPTGLINHWVQSPGPPEDLRPRLLELLALRAGEHMKRMPAPAEFGEFAIRSIEIDEWSDRELTRRAGGHSFRPLPFSFDCIPANVAIHSRTPARRVISSNILGHRPRDRQTTHPKGPAGRPFDFV